MLIHFTRQDIERFWRSVDQSGGPDACWPWIRGKGGVGYGAFNVDGKKSLGAHRIALALSTARITESGCTIALESGVHTCHNCPGGDNRWCCNPRHLFLGSQAENNRDAYNKGRIKLLVHAGASHPLATIDEHTALSIICEVAKGGKTYDEIAIHAGTTPAIVAQIMSGRTWSHVPIPDDVRRAIEARKKNGRIRRPSTKITDLDASAIRQRYAAGGISYRALAREYGITHGTVGEIIRGDIH